MIQMSPVPRARDSVKRWRTAKPLIRASSLATNRVPSGKVMLGLMRLRRPATRRSLLPRNQEPGQFGKDKDEDHTEGERSEAADPEDARPPEGRDEGRGNEAGQ